MSEIAGSGIPSTPQTITNRLAALRRRVLGWLIVDGVCKLTLLLLAMLAFDLLVDWLFQLDLAQRVIMLGLMVIGMLVGIYYWMVVPLRHRPNDDALCLQVEDRFNNLKQAVISSLQFSRMKNVEHQGVSLAMVSATVEQGAEAAEEVDFGQIVDHSRFILNAALFGIAFLVLVLAGIGAAQQGSFLSIWFDRNLRLQEVDWPRNTYIEVEGVREDGTILLTRGEDHRLIARIREDSKVIPDKLSIEFRDGGARSVEEMTPIGEEGTEFELMFRNVSSRFQFRALGGRDGRTNWIQVELVDPPTIEVLTMTVMPPAYTGQADYKLPPGSGPYNILLGSSLALEGETNKDLTEASLSLGNVNWPLEMKSERKFKLEIPAEDLIGGKYQFNFVDVDNITPSRPETFALRITNDRAPKILATTKGISGMVVPRVRIPLEATITDDFSIEKINLTYEWRGLNDSSVPQNGEVDFRGLGGFYGDAEVPFRDLVDLEPLKIPPGAGLKFTLNAVDNCAIDGANEGKSNEFLVRVVTENELRTDLLRREKEQRQELERLLATQEDLLIETTAMLADVRSGQDPLESLVPMMRGDLLDMMRNQSVLGTNLGMIANNFQEFLEEVINNRIDEEERTLQDRLNGKIILPLREIDQYDIQDSVARLEASRRVLDNPEQLDEELAVAVDLQRSIVARLKEVLEAMVKAEGYQEAVNLLNEIKRAEEEVHNMTKQRHEQRLRDILGGGGAASSNDSDANSDNGSDDDSSADDDSGDDDGGDDDSSEDNNE